MFFLHCKLMRLVLDNWQLKQKLYGILKYLNVFAIYLFNDRKSSSFMAYFLMEVLLLLNTV